ncbi:DNA polymerase III subunit beta [Streptacidiphilus carbonis]|uniref:DNA polymerase III subunit beta n=1 Tax=Streptacidiphilus carbonis TaxID=105422 RepID=UPI0005A9F2B2|nr:DNA polymerase III subunit beta [Streptacidiphilus carbonis]
MKLTVDRTDLARALHWASRSIPARPTAPVLAGVLIEADTAGTLTLAGFDWDVSSRSEVGAEVGEPGRAVVSGRLLADLVRGLPHTPVTLAAQDSHLHLTCGRSRLDLPLMVLRDYPQLPYLPPVVGTVDGAELAAALTRVTPCAGRDAARPALTGVHLTARGDGLLRLAATDAYRVATATVPFTPNGPAGEFTALAPAESLTVLGKDLADSGTLTLACDGAVLGLDGGTRTATTRLLDCECVKTDPLFPAEFGTTVRVDAAELAAAAARLAPLLSREAPVVLDVTADGIDLRAGDQEQGTGTDGVDGELLHGDPITIRLKPRYLIDALTGLDAVHADLSLITPTKPVLITAADAPDPAPFRALVMPIRDLPTKTSTPADQAA